MISHTPNRSGLHRALRIVKNTKRRPRPVEQRPVNGWRVGRHSAGSDHFQGFRLGTPEAAKSSTLRVAIFWPCTSAVAAKRESMAGIGSRSSPVSRPQRTATSRSTGRMRPANQSGTSRRIQRCKRVRHRLWALGESLVHQQAELVLRFLKLPCLNYLEKKPPQLICPLQPEIFQVQGGCGEIVEVGGLDRCGLTSFDRKSSQNGEPDGL